MVPMPDLVAAHWWRLGRLSLLLLCSHLASQGARVKQHQQQQRQLWSLGHVLAEEAEVDREPGVDVLIDENDAADIVRHLMRSHHRERNTGEVDIFLTTLESMVNVKRSRPEAKPLTCTQASLFLWLVSKWRLDVALVHRESEEKLSSLVECTGRGTQDSTCVAMETIAERCADDVGFSMKSLLAERIALLQQYVSLKQAENAEADAQGDDDSDQEDEEDEMLLPNFDDVDAGSNYSSEQLPWHPPCRSGKRVHPAVGTGFGASAKCKPPHPGLPAGTCPRPTHVFCYNHAPEERCCCAAGDTEKNFGRKRRATAQCAAGLLIAEARHSDAVSRASSAASQEATSYEFCQAGRKVHEVKKKKGISKCSTRAARPGHCPGDIGVGGPPMNHYCYEDAPADRCCCRKVDLDVKGTITLVKKGSHKCSMGLTRTFSE